MSAHVMLLNYHSPIDAQFVHAVQSKVRYSNACHIPSSAYVQACRTLLQRAHAIKRVIISPTLPYLTSLQLLPLVHLCLHALSFLFSSFLLFLMTERLRFERALNYPMASAV